MALSTIWIIGGIIMVFLFSGGGWILNETSNEDLCNLNDSWGAWTPTGIENQYHCEPENTDKFCWNVTDWDSEKDARCMLYKETFDPSLNIEDYRNKKKTKSNVFSQDVFKGYKLVSSTGREAVLFDTVINGNSICLTDKLGDNRKVNECTCTEFEVDGMSCKTEVCANVTYNLPPSIELYDKKQKLKQTISETSKEFCYNVDDPFENLYLKFGNESIVIEGDVSFNSTDINITQEPGYAHLEVNDSELKLFMPFIINDVTVRDFTNNSNDGTIAGGVTWNATGGYDGFGAYEFDGVDSVIDIGDSPSLRFTDQITMSAWVKMDSISGSCGFFYKGGNAENGDYSIKIDADSTLSVVLNDVRQIDSPYVMPTKKWIFVAATYDKDAGGTDEVKLYVNGSLIDTGDFSDVLVPSADSFKIGYHFTQAFSCDATIDEVMLHNRSLSADEISDLYNNTSARYYPGGEMLFQDINITQSKQNITLNDCKDNLTTTLQAKINDDPPQTFNGCFIESYNVSDIREDSNLSIIFNSDSNGFRTPIPIGNITLTEFNSAPTHDTPTINSTLGTNLTTENLNVFNVSTDDLDNDTIKNIFNWRLNGKSIAVLNMPFESNATGTNTKDYSGFGNDGTEAGGIVWNVSGGYDGNGAYEFDGGDDNINVGTSARGDYLTFSVWIKPVASVCDGTQAISSDFNGADIEWQFVCLNGGRNYRFRIDTAGGNTNLDTASNPNTANTWIHLATTFNGSNMTIYVDGLKSVSRTHSSPGIIKTASNSRFIGSDAQPSQYFKGTIDDVIIFNRSLTPEQVSNIFNNRTDLLDANETALEDQWSACVTPNDGTEDGLEKCSVDLEIISEEEAPAIPCFNFSIFNISSLANVFNVDCNGLIIARQANFSDVTIDNDLDVGGNTTLNLIYGEMHFHNDTDGHIITINTQNVWENITGFDGSGADQTSIFTNGLDFNSSGNALVCLIDGRYKSLYTVSAGNVGNNQEYQFQVSVDGTRQHVTDSHRKIGASGDVGSITGDGSFRCNAGDNVQLNVKNVDGTANLLVHVANLNLMRIGG